MTELKITPKPFQEKFLNSQARYPAFISGWGCGKTLFAILRGMILTKEIPNNLGLIVRKEFTDLKDSTINDFERYTNRKVGMDKDVSFNNGSKIMFRHGDELDVLKNINLGWFFIEQAEEFETDGQFQFLRGRLRRDVPFHSGFIIGNTAGHNWIWRLWKSNPQPGHELIEATTFDNADNLPADFVKDLENLKQESPHHYNRYVLNSWEDFEEVDTLIPYGYIANNTNKGFIPDAGCILACDPAHFGDDETVITVLQRCGPKHYKQIYLKGYQGIDLMQTAGRIIDLKKVYNPEFIIIDDVGIGTGLSDRLIEQEINIARFKGGEKAIQEGFFNKRTECYWKLRTMLEQGLLDLIPDEKQSVQLSTIKYKYKSNGKKQIESKDDAKKRGVKSPDYADCLMMACSVVEAIPEAEKPMPTRAEDFWQKVKIDTERYKVAHQEQEEFRPI